MKNNNSKDFEDLARAEDDGFPIVQIFKKDILTMFDNNKENNVPIKKLKNYLNDHNIKHMTISHSLAYTSQETAQAAHIPVGQMVKTIMVEVDDIMVMIVLPASMRLQLDAIKEITGTADVKIATEAEFKSLFPDCEIGAMPPFGNLYKLPVYMADDLLEDEYICFNAGNHHELIRIKLEDYLRLVKPHVFHLTNTAYIF